MTSKLLRTAISPTIRSAITTTALRTTTAPRHFHTSLPKMTVHNIQTNEDFKETIAKNEIVILDAFAVWCGPCKAIAPTIAKWSEEAEFKDKVHFAKFDVDELPELSQELGIRAMPTFVFFKNGEKVDEFVGGNPGPLLAALKKNAA